MHQEKTFCLTELRLPGKPIGTVGRNNYRKGRFRLGLASTASMPEPETPLDKQTMSRNESGYRDQAAIGSSNQQTDIVAVVA
jgi:hypothetical protein